MKPHICHTSQETQSLGYRLGQALKGGTAIALTGDLGAGKTTFTQGIARGLGLDESCPVTSPTFNIINEYPGRLRLCHLDLYRLADVEELEYIGFEDLLGDDSVIVVEWPGLLKEDRFEFDLEIQFEFDADYNRVITCFASGQRGSNVLSKLFS